MNPQNPTYIAVDIAKERLQVQAPHHSFSMPYHAEALKMFMKRLRRYEYPLVVCEATGGYERLLLKTLWAHEIAAALVNPERVRAFARSEGLKAKSDPIDAQLLLRFARERNPKQTPPPDPSRGELAALMDRRSQLTEQLAREKNRLKKSPETLHPMIQRMTRFIEKELRALDARIRKLIASNRPMHQHAELMQTVVGVGEVTAWTLLAYLAEIAQVNRNSLVALAGVAPYNNDSGRKQGTRCIKGGRDKVRKSLYMAAQSAAVHNPVIKKYVAGLRERGKPYKCAQVAAMRKILIHLQSLIKNNLQPLAL